MASIRKLPNGKILAEVRLKGHKAYSKTFTSRTAAKQWADDKEHKIKNSGDIIYGKTLKDAFDRYKKEESPRKKGSRWEIIRLEKIGRDKIADNQLGDLNASDFEDWIKRQRAAGLSDSSIRRELQVISGVFTFCRKWNWMSNMPLKDIKFPPKAPHRDKTYSDEQIKRVLEALEWVEGNIVSKRQRIAAAFLIAIETAMRQGELWGLTWEHVHIDRRFVHLPDTKNGTSRDVPLSKRAIEIINWLNPGKGRIFDFSQSSAGVVFRRALTVAGIEDMTFHDTRHCATTRMARKVDMLTLAKITGHKDPRMLSIYYNPKPHDIADLLD